jgi:glucuronate isomerase
MPLSPDRLFDPDPAQKTAAMDLYALVQNLPIVSPHGHVDPALFSDPEYRFGNHPNFSLLLFTLDESTYARELAPLAGAYPSVKLGPTWWFHDSWNGLRRYFDRVMETAGMYNTAGFNDDTRAFLSIPARHDVWRRAAANWLAGLLVRRVIDNQEAESMVVDLAIGLAKKAYRLE